MFEQILQLVKEHAGDAIVNNPAIPDERNNEAIETAAGSLFNNLKNEVGAGGADSILAMFSGGGNASANPLPGNISSGVAGDLMKKLGIDQSTAAGIVNQIIPVVMDNLKNKTNDPNDSSINLESIIGSLTGNGSDGIFGAVKGLFGRN